MALDNAALTLAGQPAFEGLTDQQAADLANTPSITVKYSEKRNLNWLIKHVPGGLATINTLAGKLNTAGYTLIPQMLATDNGIDFSDDVVQNTLTALGQANVLSADEVATLKKIGVEQITPYKNAGGDGNCTAQAFTEARAYIALQNLKRTVATRYNDVINAIDAKTVTTAEQAAAALGAAL